MRMEELPSRIPGGGWGGAGEPVKGGSVRGLEGCLCCFVRPWATTGRAPMTQKKKEGKAKRDHPGRRVGNMVYPELACMCEDRIT